MQITKQSLKNKNVFSLEAPANYLNSLNLKSSKVYFLNMTANNCLNLSNLTEEK